MYRVINMNKQNVYKPHQKMTSIKQLIDQVPIESLQELSDYIAYKQRKPKQQGMNQYKAEDYLLYEKISSALSKLITAPVMPFNTFKRQKKYAKFLELVEYLDNYADQVCQKKTTRYQKTKFYRLYISLVADEIINRTEAPLCMSTIMNNYERFPGLLENAFPGYLESGFGYKIFLDPVIQ